jgi:hypothetical protein
LENALLGGRPSVREARLASRTRLANPQLPAFQNTVSVVGLFTTLRRSSRQARKLGTPVERDRGELVPELLVDLIADGGRPGRVRLTDGLLEQGIDGRVGEPAEVATTA